jgi:hypothetical protein
MRHYAARTVPDRLLFTTWAEGIHFWRLLSARTPGALSCVMPDHIHVLAPSGFEAPIRHSMAAYARWLNYRHGRSGPLWRHLSDDAVADAQKLHRSIRYIHLNPCRSRLVGDPLAWPLSTHRDLVGLTLRPIAEPRRNAHDFHRYVSGDPSVNVAGTLLPAGALGTPDVGDIIAAVSALTRRTVEQLSRSSTERTLLIRAARTISTAPSADLAERLGVSRRTIYRAEGLEPHAERMIRRVIGDPRFPALFDDGRPPLGNRRRWRDPVDEGD